MVILAHKAHQVAAWIHCVGIGKEAGVICSPTQHSAMPVFTGLHLRTLKYDGAPHRSNHFCTNFSLGDRHTHMMYLNKFSVKGVVWMGRVEKGGSSRTTVKPRSLVIMVVS